MGLSALSNGDGSTCLVLVETGFCVRIELYASGHKGGPLA